jgi:hypothetical protein
LGDDVGVFGLWNPEGFVELFFHSSGVNLFSGSAQGQQGTNQGALQDATTYQGLLRVVNNSGNVRFGDGGDRADAGFALWDNASVDQRAYTGNIAGAPQTYDTLALLFINNNAGAATLTVAVPEPSCIATAGLGLAAMIFRRRFAK